MLFLTWLTEQLFYIKFKLQKITGTGNWTQKSETCINFLVEFDCQPPKVDNFDSLHYFRQLNLFGTFSAAMTND